MSATPHTSFRLGMESRSMLRELSRVHGISQRAVLEVLIRREMRARELERVRKSVEQRVEQRGEWQG